MLGQLSVREHGIEFPISNANHMIFEKILMSIYYLLFPFIGKCKVAVGFQLMGFNLWYQT